MHGATNPTGAVPIVEMNQNETLQSISVDACITNTERNMSPPTISRRRNHTNIWRVFNHKKLLVRR
jgi:hypothetical protein